MSTILKNKLEEAYKGINEYVWKGPRIDGKQEVIRLLDCDYDQLKKYYTHCYEMLYNNDKKKPGRLTMINIIDDQIKRCRAELLIRWMRLEKNYPSNKCFEDLRNIINANKEILTQEAIKTYPIGEILNSDDIPLEYKDIPISLVMDACLDSLGNYDKHFITMSFLTKMGLSFTPQEKNKDLYRKDYDGNTMNILDVVKQELGLRSEIILHLNKKGLTFPEFKAMCRLRYGKYSNLTTEQLKILSNKILYKFQIMCEEQAKQWYAKMEEIKAVAEHKGWDVTREIS